MGPPGPNRGSFARDDPLSGQARRLRRHEAIGQFPVPDESLLHSPGLLRSSQDVSAQGEIGSMLMSESSAEQSLLAQAMSQGAGLASTKPSAGSK